LHAALIDSQQLADCFFTAVGSQVAFKLTTRQHQTFVGDIPNLNWFCISQPVKSKIDELSDRAACDSHEQTTSGAASESRFLYDVLVSLA
jgi:hypothetical protein